MSNEVEKVEFEFPDEAKSKEEKPEIEIVDDTPEKDRGRKPLEREVVDPNEDELATYSEKVQGRIKELTHARHDERRAREALRREHDELTGVAQRALNENKELKEKLVRGETNFVSQAQKLAEINLSNAKTSLKVAHEAGDTDAFVEAQQALNLAQSQLQRVQAYRPPLTTPAASDNVPPQQTQQPRTHEVDDKATAWRSQNTWFGDDDEMTSFALGLHNKLVKANYDPKSEEYYDAINRRMRQVFPDQFKAEPTAKSEPIKKPATVVAPASRSSSAKKVTLTQSQVQLAKRLGVPLEIYARQVAALESKNG